MKVVVAILLLMIGSIISCQLLDLNTPVATIEKIDKRSKQERTIKEITLSGSGYELGKQHGQKLKSEIASIIEKWKQNTSLQLKRDADEVLREFFEYAQFENAIRKYTPDLFDEIRGIAEGSGQTMNDIMVLNLLDEFWVYVDDPNNHHCSNIGVASIEGGVGYVAQNMDIENYTDGFQTLIRLEKTDERPEQLLLTHPGLIVLNGMNEKGIGVVVNTIMQLKASNKGLPVAFVIRRIINSTNKQELLQFITSVPHASGQNYMIGIMGEIFSYEASANKVVQFNPKNSNGTVCHTNHPIVNDDLKERYMAYNPFQNGGNLPLNSNSYIRLEAVKERVSEKNHVTDEDIKQALRSKDNTQNPVCRNWSDTGFAFTFASVIMQLNGSPSLQITAGPPDESDYKRYHFEQMEE